MLNLLEKYLEWLLLQGRAKSTIIRRKIYLNRFRLWCSKQELETFQLTRVGIENFLLFLLREFGFV